jgi:hypothetical protein
MKKSRLIQQFRQGPFIYRLEYIFCGKENCKKCQNKEGHGPYWYALIKVKDKNRSIYIGRTLILLDSPQGREKLKALKILRDDVRQKTDRLTHSDFTS